MGKADFAVFVGRFQPVHRAHLDIMEEALKGAKELIVVVGSATSPRSLRNPWTFDERLEMIRDAVHGRFKDGRANGIRVVPLRDFTYSDTHWAVGLQNAVRNVTKFVKESPSVKLFGCFKDPGGEFLSWFPQWELVMTHQRLGFNSRDVRDVFFGPTLGGYWLDNEIFDIVLTPEVIDFMKRWRDVDSGTGKFYHELAREHEFVRKYRESWSSAPFPPTFVTTDMVVLKGGHVLLVRRGMNPGKGRLALPGGFVKQDRSILESALDELKEETRIVYPRERIVSSVRSSHVFDHPDRDLRGRTITHAFCARLPMEGPLPEVRGGDDAAEALWMPLAELPLHEADFFSDHFHIIDFFVHQEGPK